MACSSRPDSSRYFLRLADFGPASGVLRPPARAVLYLLLWEWFRIYFESGVAKITGGDPEWRHFTALDEYYQNGPLPTWIGWYVQHLPHWFHATTAFFTLALELVADLGGVPSAADSHRALLCCHALADRHHSDCQLHVL